MNATKRRSRKHIQINSDSHSDLKTLFPQNIYFYKLPPLQDIMLDKFEEIALERLSVLRILENANAKNLTILSDEWKSDVLSEIKVAHHKNYLNLIYKDTSAKKIPINEDEILLSRYYDYVSHFILRLVYCRSKELKKWFLLREIELFKLKFATLSENEIKRFFEINQLNFQLVKNEEINDLIDEDDYDDVINSSTEFYRVHFTEVPDLIQKRECFLKNGSAYITIRDFSSILINMHNMYIERGLIETGSILHIVDNDIRISKFLKYLATSYIGFDYVRRSKNTIPIAAIDNLSETSFPLCMRKYHEIIRKEHHLNYFEQTEYVLFLKGIGVSLEDAMRLVSLQAKTNLNNKLHNSQTDFFKSNTPKTKAWTSSINRTNITSYIIMD